MQFALDPSSFNEDQQRLIDRLRALEQAAARSAKSVSGVGLGIVAFFRMLDRPLASLQRHFENLVSSTHRPRVAMKDLAAEGRRTGAAVEAGAATGAAGLRALGVAGLSAFAVVKALSKLMGGAAENAQRVFGTSILAGSANAPIKPFTAISQAIYAGGGGTQEQTQAWAAQWEQQQLEFARSGSGPLAGQLAQLAIANVGINALTDTYDQVLAESRRRSRPARSRHGEYCRGHDDRAFSWHLPRDGSDALSHRGGLSRRGRARRQTRDHW